MYKKIAVLTGLMLLNVFPAFAVDEYSVDGDNYSYRFLVYNEGEELDIGGKKYKSPFTLSQSNLQTLTAAAQKWAYVIKTTSPKPKEGYAIVTEDEYNASAISSYTKIEESPYPVTYVNATINNLHIIDDDDDDDDDDPLDGIYGIITIGYGIEEDNPGWQDFNGLHSLLHNQSLPDLYTTLLHEFMHSLGYDTDVSQQRPESTDPKGYYFTEKDTDNLTVWDKNLRLYSGSYEVFDADDEIVPTSQMSVGKNRDFDIFEYSPYFVGEETIKVLGGQDDYDDARVAIIQNGGLTSYSASYDSKETRPQVFGMPIHNADSFEPDLAHTELRNSFMSHQAFRNWLVPMEAELALLKDLGYNIELRDYFGKSYYLDDITDTFATGYSEWNGSAYTGNPSNVAQGVGLHIYGDNNKITQTSDIVTNGEGSFGVRIDGVNNQYTLSGGSSIETNGKENLGIAVTWGKGHIVNIEKNAEVTATGDEGIAVAFDFGENMFGNLDDTRGSYINYDGEDNRVPLSETDKALVKQFNVAGTLSGKLAAIYIADNAHVEAINILNGAYINGNIVSDWNSEKSGPKSRVMREESGEWTYVDVSDESQIYFTDININVGFNGTINGSIDGEVTDGINTLRLNNEGIVNIKGEKIAVYSFDNSGAVDIDNAVVSVQNGEITGIGEINAVDNLELAANIKQIDNIVNLQSDALFSTINDEIGTVEIMQLNADNAKISFDLGDKYVLKNASQDDTASISKIILTMENADTLQDGATYELFGDADKVLDLGDSYGNVYYNNKKYYLTQDDQQKNLLRARMSDEKVTLHEAVENESAINYIMTKDNKQTEDVGTVNGGYFEISGEDVDVNGYKGLTVDGEHNSEKTVLKTGIYGAKGSNVSVVNNGNLEVIAKDKEIVLGGQDETAVYLDNGSVSLNASKYAINVDGAIKGTEDGKNEIKATGKSVSLNEVDNVSITAMSTEINMGDVAHNTTLISSFSDINVADDAFLAADGSNELSSIGGTINLLNGKASPITLNKIELLDDTKLNIDIDLANETADRLVVPATENLSLDGAKLNIDKVNLLNQNAALTAEKIKIPFISEEFNNQNLLGNVEVAKLPSLLTPIFKYDFGYNEDKKSGNFVLQRGSSSQYESYNPAIVAAPVATLSGYLTQLHAYDTAFNNIGEGFRTTGNRANYQGQTTVMPDKTLWIKPSSSFEKLNLKNGPEIKDNMYDVYAGIDAPTAKVFSGGDLRYGVYAGYNYSRQKYEGNTIRQNGGTLGLVAHLYKNGWFNTATVNAGLDKAEESTMYGKEDFNIFRYGIADKIGFNWLSQKKNFVVQPSLLLSYTTIRTSNYYNAANVKITSDPLHAFNVAPGVRLACNLRDGWQPYAEAKMVWNIMNDTDFAAQRINLPEMSVKPYVQYGVGVQKIGAGRISGYGQVDMLSGGRRGVDMTVGIRWAF